MARLVRFEAARLARNPLLWAAVGYATVMNGPDPDQLPTWGAFVDLALVASSKVAAGLFVAANAAAVREARYDTLTAAPVSRTRRLVALLVAILVTGVLASAVPLPGLVWQMCVSPPDPVAGPLEPAAFALIPATVAVGGTLGAAAGTWTRSYLPAAVVLLVFVGWDVLTSWSESLSTATHRDLFLPWERIFLGPGGLYDPGYWFLVPAHLAYLLLLACAGIVLALLRSQPGRRRRIVVSALAVTCVAGATDAYVRQTGPANPLDDVESSDMGNVGWPEDAGPPPVRRECQTRGGVRYCAYHTYEQWIPRWERAVRRVRDPLPQRARDDLPVVAQKAFASPRVFQAPGSLAAREIAVPEDPWLRPPDDSESELAWQAATIVVGAPGESEECTTSGQARMPLMYWLTRHTLDDDTASDTSAITTSLTTNPSPEDLAVTLALLDAPDSTVSRGLHRHWERLLSPHTTASDAARLLGAKVTDAHRRAAERTPGTVDEDRPASPAAPPSDDGFPESAPPDPGGTPSPSPSTDGPPEDTPTADAGDPPAGTEAPPPGTEDPLEEPFEQPTEQCE